MTDRRQTNRKPEEQGAETGTAKKIRAGKFTYLLLAAAIVLLAVSGIGSANAALTYYSENYTAQVSMYNIGVTLVETSASGTKNISSRDYTGSGDVWEETQGVLLEDMLAETDGKLLLGKEYTEGLSVMNSGNIDEYVRVSIYKYWTDENGERVQDLAPALIDLNLTDSGWIVDENASTEERIVLYWPQILSVGETTATLSDTLRIDDSVASKVTTDTKTENGMTTTTTTFNYDGAQFNLEAEVDAVQTHNAAEAIKSAWGIDVNVGPDGSLSLAQ